MKLNGQNLIKYTGFSPDDVVMQITKAWKTVYSDCRIVSLSIVYVGNLVYCGYVVFQEVTDDGEAD